MTVSYLDSSMMWHRERITEKQEDYFPELNFDALRVYATKWHRLFPKARRVSLHAYIATKPTTYRYAVVFELPSDNDFAESARDIIFHDFLEQGAFAQVYRKGYQRSQTVEDDWFFFPKEETEEWPVFALQEPHWQLYPNAVDKPKSQRHKPGSRFFFELTGDYWNVGFQGEAKLIRDRNSIRYVVQILANQNKAVSVLQLVSIVSGQDPTTTTDETTEDRDIDLPGAYFERIVDSKGEKDFADGLNGLLYALHHETPEKRIEAKIRIEETKKILRQEFGLVPILDKANNTIRGFGRLPNTKERGGESSDRTFKRAQDLVGKSLKAAYRAIKKAGLSDLADHLSESIRPAGNRDYVYADTSIEWDLRW